MKKPQTELIEGSSHSLFYIFGVKYISISGKIVVRRCCGLMAVIPITFYIIIGFCFIPINFALLQNWFIVEVRRRKIKMPLLQNDTISMNFQRRFLCACGTMRYWWIFHFLIIKKNGLKKSFTFFKLHFLNILKTLCLKINCY